MQRNGLHIQIVVAYRVLNLVMHVRMDWNQIILHFQCGEVPNRPKGTESIIGLWRQDVRRDENK